ncbi:MAG: response regulator transcription factor [Anaerolinea sp.]|jgi:DNA-binding NarL/FixJ family response regulator
MTGIRILLADDHALVRRGIRLLLETDPNLCVVGESASGEETLEQLRQFHPDVLLLDISMPGITGLEILTTVLEISPSTAVIMLSMYKDEEYIARALQAGARGYLWKDVPDEELIRAIRTAVAGEVYLPPGVPMERIQEVIRAQPPVERLTAREKEVLTLLASGCTTQAIALALGISPKTVETHRGNLMKKLDLYDIASLTRFALRHGLIQET